MVVIIAVFNKSLFMGILYSFLSTVAHHEEHIISGHETLTECLDSVWHELEANVGFWEKMSD